jgi:type IV pilus assembly protein PilE
LHGVHVRLDAKDPTGTYGWAAGEPTRSTYTIVATPINAQVTRDTQCGALKIDQAGTRTIGGTGTLNQCW